MEFNLQTAVIFLMCINIMLFIGGVRVIEQDNFLDNIIDLDAYENDSLAVTDEFSDSIPDNYENTGEGSVLTFIDTLKAVKNFLIFIVNIVFTPFGLFIDLPAIVGLILGVPLIIGSSLAFIYFVRAGR